MDPQACFMRWVEAPTWADAFELEDAYHQWIARGGFKATHGGQEVLQLDAANDRFLVAGPKLADGSGGGWRSRLELVP